MVDVQQFMVDVQQFMVDVQQFLGSFPCRGLPLLGTQGIPWLPHLFVGSTFPETWSIGSPRHSSSRWVICVGERLVCSLRVSSSWVLLSGRNIGEQWLDIKAHHCLTVHHPQILHCFNEMLSSLQKNRFFLSVEQSRMWCAWLTGRWGTQCRIQWVGMEH